MGVNFRDSAYTYTDPHGMPSGGDWGIERMGVLFLDVSEEVLVDSCVLERLDGNPIMLSGYNRNTTIQRNEFVWIGSTAIALWGDTKGTNVTGMGWDGTDGNQPRFIRILYNFAHELGIWEKQSSLNYISYNIMIANYHSIMAIDNDYGSCYYKTHHNFFAYAGGMKNDFDGHNNHHYCNIYAYVSQGFEICSQLKGHEDQFYNNMLVQLHDGDYGRGQTCSGDGKTVCIYMITRYILPMVKSQSVI